MRYVTAIVTAIVLLVAMPVTAGSVTTIDALPLRENILSVDHEWIGPDLTSTGLKLALGKQEADWGEMALLGGAIGKRWYVASHDTPARQIYTGGYLFGQQVRTVNVEGTESQTVVGIISELGVRLQTRLGPTIDIGPVATIPVYGHTIYPDGEIDDLRFPPILTNWKVGLGFSW